MPKELKPCPFCGSTYVCHGYEVVDDKAWFFCDCKSCYMNGPSTDNLKKADMYWNMLPRQAKPPAKKWKPYNKEEDS